MRRGGAVTECRRGHSNTPRRVMYVNILNVALKFGPLVRRLCPRFFAHKILRVLGHQDSVYVFALEEGFGGFRILNLCFKFLFWS